MEPPAIPELQSVGTYDLLFYVAAWSIAAACGLLSTYLDHRYRSPWDLCAIAAMSGFVSVATIGIICKFAGSTAGVEPYYIGIAIAIGLLGKKALKIVDHLLTNFFERIGIDVTGHEIETHYDSESGLQSSEDVDCEDCDRDGSSGVGLDDRTSGDQD